LVSGVLPLELRPEQRARAGIEPHIRRLGRDRDREVTRIRVGSHLDSDDLRGQQVAVHVDADLEGQVEPAHLLHLSQLDLDRAGRAAERSPVTEFSPYMSAVAASIPPPVAGDVMFASFS